MILPIRITLVPIFVLICGSAAIGQDLQMRPVARLVGGAVAAPSSTRARRVMNDVGLPASSPLSLDVASTIERTAFAKTNQVRVANGLLPLTWDGELCRMARAHSENMAKLGFFSHETPEGLELRQRARSMGIGRFKVIAENIAYNKGYNDPGAFAVERWMISSGHRSNILYQEFQFSAIGSYVASDGSVYVTQIFLAR